MNKCDMICISITAVIVFGALCAFLYAIVWLHEGFNIEKELTKTRILISNEMEEEYISKNEIMPSCYKGVSHVHKR